MHEMHTCDEFIIHSALSDITCIAKWSSKYDSQQKRVVGPRLETSVNQTAAKHLFNIWTMSAKKHVFEYHLKF